MRAVYAARFGGDEPLSNLEVGERPEPVAAPGQAIVRIASAALNHHDLWTLRGISSRPLTEPQILGCDAAGTVESYAGGVVPDGAPQPGVRVVVHSVMTCGHCRFCLAGEEILCPQVGILSEPPYGGTLAERVAVPLRNLVPLPESVDIDAAACLPTAYLTAYRMLFTRAALRPGMQVLVHGASGGVATACILLGTLAGLTVHATSRDPEKRAAAERLGAASAFAPDDRDASKRLMRETGGMDAVIETVGEPTWELSLRSVRPGGTVVVAGATAGPNPPAQLHRIFWRHITVAGSSMGTRAELELLVQLCAEGRLKPLVDAVRPLEEAPQAFAEMEAGEQSGKLLLHP